MASKVTPSLPGAPSLDLAISYAARSVSILQTCTYSPQNRHCGSAFALTYSFRLRSCKVIGVFIIPPASPLAGSTSHTRAPSLRGHYSASSLVWAHPTPARLRSPSRCCRLYNRLPSAAHNSGPRRFSPVAQRVLCHPAVDNHPAGVTTRLGQIASPSCCLRL